MIRDQGDKRAQARNKTRTSEHPILFHPDFNRRLRNMLLTNNRISWPFSCLRKTPLQPKALAG